MQIATELFKSLVEKSIKGSGRLPQLTITSVVTLEVQDGHITLTTTDGATNLVVSDNINTDETFVAATDSDLLYKLVSKTTTNKITLSITDKELSFVGNGAYSLPLILDEEGNMAKIPQILVQGEEYKCKMSELRKLTLYNKNSVLKDMTVPIYTGYCLKGGYGYTFCISGGCVTKLDIDENVTALMRPQMVDLLDVFNTDEELTVCTTDKSMKIQGKVCTIYSTLLDGINEYATQKLKSLITDKEQFKNKLAVNKVTVSNALDRLSLFILPEEANAVMFNVSVTNKTLSLMTKNSAGAEVINIEDTSELAEDVSRYIDYKDLKTLVDSVKTDNVIIRYNTDESLCIQSDGANMFTTYLEDSETDDEQLEMFEDEEPLSE